MKALFSFGADVPASRVIAEHRRWLTPIGALLVINLVVLVAVVLPLRRAVASGASRAAESTADLRAAITDLRDAEATRDGQSKAAIDLERFYADVLPKDFTSARRITHVKLAQLARAHDVTFESGAATPESMRDSQLERLHVNYSLSGDWDDIRQFIFEIETGPDFVIIDNVQLAESGDNAPLVLTLDMSTYYRTGNAR
jgi:Tfp pilus assembly protein PilO